MQCPRCGTEVLVDAKICSLCGCVLEDKTCGKPVVGNAKTSRLAIASLVLSFFGLFTFLITAMLSIALGITSLVRIGKNEAALKGRFIAVAGIVISAISIMGVLVIFVLWGFDAAPITDDYTVADLRSAGPECAHSYELLVGLADEDQENRKDAPAIGLSAQDVNIITQVSDLMKEADYAEIADILRDKADGICRAWENARKGRDVLFAPGILLPMMVGVCENPWFAWSLDEYI